MNRVKAVISISRPLNLAIIVLTQLLFWYCVILPVHTYFNAAVGLEPWQLGLLVLSTAALAAGGYAINDYYDLPIDMINRPDKVVVGRHLPDAAVFNMYLAATATGVLAAGVVALSLGKITLILPPAVVASLLWYYAQQFKRTFLLGNAVVAAATAYVIFALLVFEVDWGSLSITPQPETYEVLKFGRLYIVFSLLATMLREGIKDLEDLEGDRQMGCRTLPVVTGITGGRINAVIWSLCLSAGLLYLERSLWQYGNKEAVLYLVVLVQLPVLTAAAGTIFGKGPRHFRLAGNLVKLAMVAGVLSMIYIGYILGAYG